MKTLKMKYLSAIAILLTLASTEVYAKPNKDTQLDSLYSRYIDSVLTHGEGIELNDSTFNELAKLYPPKPPKDLAIECQKFKVRYQLTEQFELLSSELIYPLNTRECSLSDRIGMLNARLKHKSGLWEVYPKLNFVLGNRLIQGATKERIMADLAPRMAENFNFGKRYTSINLQERRDLLELLRQHPKRVAKRLFNAEELYSFPLNFSREKLGEKGFHCGRAYYILKNGYWFGLYVLSAEQAPVDFDAFLPQLKGLFTFE